VERTLDGTEFEAIGRVDGAGDANSIQQYVYEDEEPYNGFSYYRIKQTDHDGTSDHSNTVSVWLMWGADQPMIIPNPVQENALVGFNSADAGELLAEIIDPFGRIVFARMFPIVAGRNMIELRTDRLPTGVYMLTMTGAQEKQIVQFIKD
nr:T9SS type A sorting domain-containing protein [Bacteroidota bacterium]